jgi:hypothetical protein
MARHVAADLISGSFRSGTPAGHVYLQGSMSIAET